MLLASACAARSTGRNSQTVEQPRPVVLTVEGRLIDTRGEPIADAEMGLQDPAQTIWHPLGTTDAEGRFAIRETVSGGRHSSGRPYSYALTASVGGLMIASQRIEVPPSAQRTLTVELEAGRPDCSQVTSSAIANGSVTRTVLPRPCPFDMPNQSAELPPPSELPATQRETDTINSVFMPAPPPPLRNRTIDRLRVYYATNRVPEIQTGSLVAPYYQSGAGSLRYGYADVDVARRGLLAVGYALLTFDQVSSNDYAVTAVRQVPEDEFYAGLSKGITAAPTNEAVVFVHGYNVPFVDAIQTAALVSYQIGFKGVPIAYAWPGQERWWRYGAALDEVNAASDKLATVLRDIASRSGAARIHLVAHSLGNGVLVEALQKHRQQGGQRIGAELIMAAPDVSTNRFAEVVGSLASVVSRITLYASSLDVPLWVAGKVKAYPRIGFSQPPLPRYQATDSVDATGVDLSPLGHSYYADSDILQDLAKIINDAAPPADRGLKQLGSAAATYWTFGR